VDGLRERRGRPKTAARAVGGSLSATVHTFKPIGEEEVARSFAVARSGCRFYLVQSAGGDAAVDFAAAVLGEARRR